MLMDQYVRTAEMLREGQQVAETTLQQFHGTTGLLLAEIYSNLWTQGELQEMMRSMIKEHNRECRQDKHWGGRSLAGEGWTRGTFMERLGGALIDNIRLILVCVTVVVTAAIVWQQLPQLGAMIERQQGTLLGNVGRMPGR